VRQTARVTDDADAPRRTHAPGWLADYVAHPEHGPLPALLLVLTVATGMVDAVSILALGRVFVANMTGNIVFIGFALAGAPGFSLQASLVALAAFLLGAAVGGAVVARFVGRRGPLLRTTAGAELVLMLAATLVLAVASRPYGHVAQDVTVAFAGIGLGMQNAAARKLAVPDLTTTVLTMTLTGVAADLRNRDYRVAARRVVAVASMLVGAIVGAVLVLHADPAAALGVACALIAVVFAGAATRATHVV
jgi:uncharacterized membrane protein YoaK (UPF0700 family)